MPEHHPVGTSEDELTRLRRRDRELSGLLNSSRALVQVADVDRLLQELVDRAAELMGADMTYLSVYDEDTGDLWVRASHGVVSPELKTLRVPSGAGLASQVVASKTAQWTSDYEHAELLSHPTVSAAVRTEGIQCLLGAPMLAEGQILGALFAADRYRHDFTTDQVALLTAFADHAALVVHRARLFSAVEQQAREAASARAVAEERAAQSERAAQLHEHLTQLTLGGHDTSTICEALATALGHRVCAARSTGELLTTPWEGPWTPQGRPEPGLQEALGRSASAGGTVTARCAGQDVGVTTTVAAGTPLVSLVVDRPHDLSGLDRRTLERTAQLLSLLLMQQDARSRAEELVRGELAADLVNGSTSQETLQHRALAQGIHLERAYTPVVVPLEPGVRGAIRQHLLATTPEALVDDGPGGLTVLLPGSAPRTRVQALRRAMGPRLGERDLVVHGRPGTVAELPDTVALTRRLTRMLPRIGVTTGTVDLLDLAPYLTLFGDNADLAQDFVRRTLGDLLAWDARHDSHLVGTLAAHLDHNGNLRRTAEQLYVHVNTVKQRMARISTLLGEDWREPERQFQLRVAVRLHRAGTDPQPD